MKLTNNPRFTEWKVLILFSFLVIKNTYSQEDSVSYKYQNYKEDDHRVQIIAHYARWEASINERVRLNFTGLRDAISGASPTGLEALIPGDPLPRATLPNEVRLSGVLEVNWEQNRDFEWAGQISYSKEPDYSSKGLSLSGLHYLNQKNTTIRYGISRLNDHVKSSPLNDQKTITDILVGWTQVLDRKTLFSLNFTVGSSSGYLADPYKGVGRTQLPPFPGFPVFIRSFYESRPDERTKLILYTSLQHYFESLNGSSDLSYRIYKDNWDILSHTIELNWRQKIGEHIVLEPFVRYYNQTEAEFYLLTLDGTNIDPDTAFEFAIPTGEAPYYSADYRLSNFEATTVGLKVNWIVNEVWKFDLSYERYDMNGLDATPSDAYVTANIYTLGVSCAF